MDAYKLDITIPGLPKTTNGSHGSWYAAAAQRKLWKRLTAHAIGIKVPRHPLEVAKLTFIRASSMEPDGDNLIISFKPLRDALKDCKIIVDDKPRNVPDPIYQWQKTKKKEGFVRIIVEEIDAAK